MFSTHWFSLAGSPKGKLDTGTNGRAILLQSLEIIVIIKLFELHSSVGYLLCRQQSIPVLCIHLADAFVLQSTFTTLRVSNVGYNNHNTGMLTRCRSLSQLSFLSIGYSQWFIAVHIFTSASRQYAV